MGADADPPGRDGAVGRLVTAGEVSLPRLCLREGALANNLAVMATYAREHSVALAPHAKTTMSPALLKRQLSAGAWAVTVANVEQAAVAAGAGAHRVLIANEVVGQPDIAWLAGAVADEAVEIFCLVDSVAGAQLLDSGLARAGIAGSLGVLLELGVPGGRTGVRDLETARQVGSVVSAASNLRLVGVEGYEGGLANDRSEASIARIDAYLDGLPALVRSLLDDRVFGAGQEIIVSAGGSKYFDRVAARLATADYGGLRARVVVRAGCYLTHDHGIYEQLSPLRSTTAGPSLQPALELWAEVLSVPEPSRAIVGLGRRDASFDQGLPTPLWRARHERAEPWRGGQLSALDDQHGYLELSTGGERDLAPGDRLGFGLSHPCTALDKWRTVLLVDDAHRVLEVLETCFH